MANSAYTQQALADEPSFHTRVKGALVTQAFVVMGETAPTEQPALDIYNKRIAYAKRVLDILDTEVQRISHLIVMRANLMAFETSYDFPGRRVVTTSGDPDILSQIAFDWNVFAGA